MFLGKFIVNSYLESEIILPLKIFYFVFVNRRKVFKKRRNFYRKFLSVQIGVFLFSFFFYFHNNWTLTSKSLEIYYSAECLSEKETLLCVRIRFLNNTLTPLYAKSIFVLSKDRTSYLTTAVFTINYFCVFIRD